MEENKLINMSIEELTELEKEKWKEYKQVLAVLDYKKAFGGK